ncbi:MAG: hypothetical protein LC676_18580, partial [Loktanella sp.]|nr:hypothetical protein [Loktanella sp.]
MSDETTGDAPQTPTLRLVGAEHVSKDLTSSFADPPANTVSSSAREREDEYHDLYIGATRDSGLLDPPFELRTLERLAQENNTLSPCIEAMVTNIDGTGYHFENKDTKSDETSSSSAITALNDFFDEVWPGECFLDVRKQVRRDIETLGNGYIEVLRNAQDDIVFLRHLDAKMIRMVKLDDPVPVAKKVQRGGREVTLNVMDRERRFAQLVNGVTLVYFKEFGASRDCHKKLGTWSNKRLPAKDRATEILHFIALPDSHTPYG